MTVDFARAVAAPAVVPIHDAIVSPQGRGVYVGVLTRLLPESTTFHDIEQATAWECPAG